MKKLNIDENKILKCIKESFGVDADGDLTE